jgi:hypothetical protein
MTCKPVNDCLLLFNIASTKHTTRGRVRMQSSSSPPTRPAARLHTIHFPHPSLPLKCVHSLIDLQ